MTFGHGHLLTQQGVTDDGKKCITITKCKAPMPVGSTPAKWEKQVPEDQIDVILAFDNIQGARVLQDELNELISIWSREQAVVVHP